MKIGILQTGHFLHARDGGNPDYDALFRALLGGRGFDFETWDVVDMVFPDSVADADGWLITGSPHGVYDDLPFIAPLETFIRDVVASGIPMVGVCFGHQIIAQALGGKVVKHAEGWRAGPEVYDFGGEEVALTAWHQDQVVELPPGAEVIARSPSCAIAALLYGGRVFSLQPHPEFGRTELGDLIDIRGPNLPPEVLGAATANIDAPVANSALADRIEAFFKVAHG